MLVGKDSFFTHVLCNTEQVLLLGHSFVKKYIAKNRTIITKKYSFVTNHKAELLLYYALPSPISGLTQLALQDSKP